jgi:hypothetical protein
MYVVSLRGFVSARSKMCSAASRHRLANAGSLALKIWKQRAKTAASRPARFGLIGEPAGPSRNTGRSRM